MIDPVSCALSAAVPSLGGRRRDDSRRSASRLLNILRQHSLPRFLLVGSSSFFLDLSLLFMLHGVLGVRVLIATAAALLITLVYNFSMNRRWAFGRRGAVSGHLVRYVILVGANLLATLLIVGVLTAAGVNYLAAKIVAAVFVAAANYVLYRIWVFV